MAESASMHRCGAFFLLAGASGLLVGRGGLLAPRRVSLRVVACADGPNPEEWREFRARLISGGGLAGLKTTTEDDGGEVKDEDAPSEASVPATQAVPRESVAPKNEELLKAQVCTPQPHTQHHQPASTARPAPPA